MTEENKKEPIFIKELEYGQDEVVFKDLSDGDKFQLTARYLNDICAFLKSILQVVADEYVLVEFICQKMGIDVRKAKALLAEHYKKEMEEKLKTEPAEREMLSLKYRERLEREMLKENLPDPEFTKTKMAESD